MKTACVWSVLAMKALAADGISGIKEPEQVSVTVRVHNYAALPGEYLRLAREEVSGIFARAGIHTHFMDCTPPPVDAGRYPECEPGGQSGAVALRLQPGFPRREMVTSSTVFGYAFLRGDGGLGTLADVYAGGAEFLAKAKGNKALEPIMLGALMAHEIGHLLLGSNKHSVAGLMRSPWGPLETNRAAQGCLRFLAAEGRNMRANCRNWPNRREQVTQAAPRSPGETESPVAGPVSKLGEPIPHHANLGLRGTVRHGEQKTLPVGGRLEYPPAVPQARN